MILRAATLDISSVDESTSDPPWVFGKMRVPHIPEQFQDNMGQPKPTRAIV